MVKETEAWQIIICDWLNILSQHLYYISEMLDLCGLVREGGYSLLLCDSHCEACGWVEALVCH